jgi:uncharacterized protein (TIGR02246 family)
MPKTQLVAHLTSHVIGQDADACARCYTEDAVLVTPAGTVKGRDEIRSFFDDRFRSFSDRDIQEELTEVDGDVDCIAVLHLTHTGPLVLPNGQTLEATGRRIRLDARELYSFDGDLIKSHRMEFDPAQAATQLTGAG